MKKAPILFLLLSLAANVLAVQGGQCVEYARNIAASVVRGYASTMAPGLDVHRGISTNPGARWIYDDWNFGFGRGQVPSPQSLIVLEAWVTGSCEDGVAGACGHVGVVRQVAQNSNGTYTLTVDESNWWGDREITFNVVYTFSPNSNTATRDGGTRAYPVRGFVYMVSNAQPVSQSTFDGAGSLVDPRNGGLCADRGNYGCSRDEVMLHPHTGLSTGVFQVLKVPGVCDFVTVEGLVQATVAVKQWNENYPGSSGTAESTVYRAIFPADIPLAKGDWSLVSVTTVSPIPANEVRSLKMRCGVGTPNRSTLTEIAPTLTNRAAQPDLVATKFDNGRYWGGNGSLMSFSNNRDSSDSAAGYGRIVDVGRRSGLGASTTIFQFYINGGNCSRVTIQATSGQRTPVEISWKPWNRATWSGVSVALPYTINAGGVGYYIAKVEAPSDGAGVDHLKASCF